MFKTMRLLSSIGILLFLATAINSTKKDDDGKITSGIQDEITQIKKLKNQKNNLETISGKCNKPLLEILGFEVENKSDDSPKLSNYAEIDFCRKNRRTCCNAQEFNSVAKKYFTSLETFEKIVEPFEEFLTFFNGPKIHEEIFSKLTQENIAKANCQQYAVTNIVEITPDFDAESNYFKEKILEALSLLTEMPYYVKRQGWLYGNLICTVCNPFDQEYIQVTEKKIELTASENTCNELAELRTYENRLAVLYGDFIKPFLDTFACVTADSEHPFSKDNLLPKLNWAQVIKEAGLIETCYQEFSEKNSCYELCEKSMTTFEVPVELQSGYVKALEAIFPILANEMSASEFYLVRKMQNIDQITTNVNFFDLGSEVANKQDFTVKIAKEGIHVFNNFFSKKLIDYKKQHAKEA